MAFSGLEPFGEFAAYHRAGIIASAITNPHIEKGKTPVKPSDFMPQYTEHGSDGAEVSPKTLSQQVRGVFRFLFGKGESNGGK